MKIIKLFIDENIKTWKKLSTKIMLIAIVLSLLAVLGIVKIMEKTEGKITTSYIYENQEEYLSQQIEYFETQLQNDKLDEETKQSMQRTLEEYKLYLEYNVSPYSDFWKNEIIQKIVDLKQSGNNPEKLLKILKENNFNEYINYQKQEVKLQLENNIISQQEYEDNLAILELKEKYEIGKDGNTDTDWKANIINGIEANQRSIRTGINQNTRKLLKAEEKQKLEEQIKISIYRLENNIPDASNGSNTNYRMRYELLAPMFSIAVISIAIIVIAGGTISNEISTGTIKFWALTPNKRWKIMTAKLLSILFYIIILVLITSLLSVAIANIFFEENGETYLYCKNGEVQEIGNTLYTVEFYFVKAIPVVLFALFAVMLSTITRNTAVSVSFSVALYIGNGLAMQILNQFITKDWIKFIPFNNLNLTSKIFTNSTDMSNLMMLITMYDSFNKRDII